MQTTDFRSPNKIASRLRKGLLLILILCVFSVFGQSGLDNKLPVRGLCIAAPEPDGLERFVKFIHEELAVKNVNTLILRVDYNYQYESHPELRDSVALSKADVKKLVEVCRNHKINLIPQINLLGHQSWSTKLTGLLRVYPQFDETPHVKIPEKYEWPNADGLYCKSYCPLHPDVHKIVFELVDEIMEVFEAKAFHAGMDEVFYIGDDKCPRCSGRDKAELFAGEVNKIRNHLAGKNQELWIWGDRLIDGKATGLGMWEASMNNTHRAIDMISKDVFICDWHYERPDPTPVIFALKGFRVATCPWRHADRALKQLEDMVEFRENATEATKENFAGMIQTVWTSAENFMDLYYGVTKPPTNSQGDQVGCFNEMFKAINAL
jgi:hypothetical protein